MHGSVLFFVLSFFHLVTDTRLSSFPDRVFSIFSWLGIHLYPIKRSQWNKILFPEEHSNSEDVYIYFCFWLSHSCFWLKGQSTWAPFFLVFPGFISSSRYKEAVVTETKLNSPKAIKNINHCQRLLGNSSLLFSFWTQSPSFLKIEDNVLS
jgi:hypothetical protein